MLLLAWEGRDVEEPGEAQRMSWRRRTAQASSSTPAGRRVQDVRPELGHRTQP